MARAYIGLGSNLDDPRQQILSAIKDLDASPEMRLTARSSLYLSKPLGPAGQPDYINAVAALDTSLNPEELLSQLQAIERQHGRTRGGVRWGPRSLDLDLLLFDAMQLETEALVIPHPGLHQRSFVLYPLAEIAPELHVPGRGILRDLLKSCPMGSLERLEEIE